MTIGGLEDVQYFVDFGWRPGEAVDEAFLGQKPDEGDASFLRPIRVLIQERSTEETNSFELVVCTPDRLSDLYSTARWIEDEEMDPTRLNVAMDVLPNGNVLPVRGLWLMRQWSHADFTGAFDRLLRSCLPAPDWGTFAYRVGLFVPWEFDYQHDRRLNRRAGLPGPSISFWHDDWQPGD